MNAPRRKKLIEVALPLEAINKAAAREKSIRHGHPSTLHLWWARRPLAACRAVLFSSLVDDPDSDPTFDSYKGEDREHAVGTRRAELFDLIEELVVWENTNNAQIIRAARAEIARSVASRLIEKEEIKKSDRLPNGTTMWDLVVKGAVNLTRLRQGKQSLPNIDDVNHFLANYAPPVLDPFAGGGSIPLEAQRLGLRAHASDLNPVAVLINKALIEIPPKFAGKPPVHPDAEKRTGWSGAQGLAEDVRRYGKWIRDEAEKRIGHLYPKVKITEEIAKERPELRDYVGQELTVIAWLWARTVPSPDPSIGGKHIPLVRSFWLSKKKGKEAFVEPIIEKRSGTYHFEVRAGKPEGGFDPNKGTVIRTGGTCLISGSPIPFEHIREQGKQDNVGQRLMAIICEGRRGRVYLEPTRDQEQLALGVQAKNYPISSLPEQALSFRVQLYGMDEHWKLFTPRQLTALVTFSDLVGEARARVLADARAAEAFADQPDPDLPLHKGGTGPQAYADAVATYLAFCVDKLADRNSVISSWATNREHARNTFGRQALPMTWDFAESNVFSDSSGNFEGGIDSIRSLLVKLDPSSLGATAQCDAISSENGPSCVISTDPPYYDNIGYADLSDFFYVWLRRSLRVIYPNILSTMLTPKSDELIATPYRHDGSKAKAAAFFEEGLGSAIGKWRRQGHGDYPTTIFYAFKQAETDASGTASTGWETFLAGVIAHGFSITATWPMRTELGRRMVGSGTNVLASSIVLACVPRPQDASLATRREFAEALRAELPEAIRNMQSGNVAPVDLAQASIGPGMGAFSRYSKVVNADGSPMSVREALQLINQVLDEVLTEQEADFDADTRWALKWFEQYGQNEGPFGDAETLAKATAVSVSGLVEAGFLKSGAGKVRLLKREELDPTWDPVTDTRLTIWEITQYLILRLEQDGETGAAELLRRLGTGHGETARELAYCLYQTCERKKRADEARSYNGLVVSWPEIERLAKSQQTRPESIQQEMF